MKTLIARLAAAWSVLRNGPSPSPAVLPQREPAKPPPYKPISPEELDHVRGVARQEEWSGVKLCRGPTKGCMRYLNPGCDDCYNVRWYDKRSSAELLQAMERGDA